MLLNTNIIYDFRFSHNLRRDTTLLAIVTMAFLTVSGGSDIIVCDPLIQFARITYRMHQVILFLWCSVALLSDNISEIVFQFCVFNRLRLLISTRIT